ncbi:CD1108 family mobile element protein [Clostridium sp. KNHs216]|uniref:C40 family peptidase n=1 Tax=Clostridium sp. KNHs216 TaxID=1550235 RepID=UPI001152A183|nr:NlpC/P60 family protein [Clostridium sp. KNHs216]TQI67299.1 NlpC/P60 family protein [Clostridium sp. KNHs216]
MEKRAPRLQFTKEERAAPVLKKSVHRVQKAAAKADQAQAKIPKKKVLRKQRTFDKPTGKAKVRLYFEKADKKKQSKLTHSVLDAPGNAALMQFHREIRKSEDENVGVEAAHKSEETAETGGRLVRSAHRSHKLKPYRKSVKAEKQLDRANLGYLQKKAARDDPQPSGNPLAHWRQKRAVKKQYAAAKRAGQFTGSAGKAAQNTSKAAKTAARQGKRAAAFVGRHRNGFLIAAGVFLVLVLLLNVLSSSSVLLEGALSGVTASTYPSTDDAMLGAEAAYAQKETDLQNEIDHYEQRYGGYDEYHYTLDKIGHDPYVLISILTAWHGGEWTLDEVRDTLSMLFSKEYQLTQTVETETRYRTETDTVTDPDGTTHTETRQIPYTYTICNVKLHNEDLSHLPISIMNEDQVGVYSMYMSTLGNRPDLFPSSAYPNASTVKRPTEYDIPPEAMADARFAAMMTEAKKYIGYPYVWGGSNPKTSFDCSGYVSWVINHSGWNVGRLGAQGLCDICTPVSPADAKPGDLVFFEHTYDTDGVSHVGIYVGNGMMLAAGDPIGYSNLNTSYWQSHFYTFGRLPNP